MPFYKRWDRKDTAALLGVFAGALAVRLAFVFFLRPPPVSDAAWYYARALGIVHGLGYTVHGYPTAYWPPGWPYFLAGVIRLFGPSVFGAEIVQAVLSALTVGIVFLIGRHVFGRLCGIAGAAAYALLPSAVEWNAVLLSEPLYTFLWAFVTYIWIVRPTRALGWFAFSGVLLGATALVRPSALFFWLILLAYLVTIQNERKHPARIAAAVILTAGCTLLTVAPFLVRDYKVYHTLVIISNNGGVSLYQSNNSLARGGYSTYNDPQVDNLISDPRTEAAGDRLASERAMQYIKSHPAHEVSLAVRKVASLYAKDDSVIRFSFGARHYQDTSPLPSDGLSTALLLLNTTVYYVFMFFAVLGVALCCLGRSRTTNPGWRLLLGMILYNTAIFAVIMGLDRYRYPTMPFFAVFAGLGIIHALGYVRDALPARVKADREARGESRTT